MLLVSVNSDAAFQIPAPLYARAMDVEHEEKSAKKSTLERWQADDAVRLKALYVAYRAEGGLSQEEFAEKFGLMSQGNMGHYLHGRRPLNLRAATSFAKGMGVAIEEFSPTIASQIEEAFPLTRKASMPSAQHVELPAGIERLIDKKVRDAMQRQRELPHFTDQSSSSGELPSKSRRTGTRDR